MNNDDDLPSGNDDTDGDGDGGTSTSASARSSYPFICAPKRPSRRNVVRKPGKSTTSGLRSPEARKSDEQWRFAATPTETERVGASRSER